MHLGFISVGWLVKFFFEGLGLLGKVGEVSSIFVLIVYLPSCLLERLGDDLNVHKLALRFDYLDFIILLLNTQDFFQA